MKTFIIPGYGIPKDIDNDQNYSTYLHAAFSQMLDAAAGDEALIIPCGGPTNCIPPYLGTEAEMIEGYIKKLIGLPSTGELCSTWEIVQEDRSLSTLENLIYAKQILDTQTFPESLTIFCEATRQHRMDIISERIFGTSVPRNIASIDFDTSANRYLDPAIIERKERIELEGSLWVLENPERLAAHHKLFERKLALLRSLQDAGMSHVDAVAEWYRQAPSVIAELMPDHPGLNENSTRTQSSPFSHRR